MKELKVFDQLTSDIATLVGPVSKLKVVDFKSSETAVAHGKTIQALLKEIEERKDKLVAPHLEFNNHVYAFVRDLKAPLEQAKAHLTRETGAFAAEQRRLKQIEDARIEAERQAEEERIAAEAQAKLDALEADKAEAAADLDPTFGSMEDHENEFARQQALVEEEAQTALLQATARANAAKYDAGRQTVKGLRMTWDCELEDIDLVPVEFLIRTLNKAALLAMARAGKIDIPGVRFFQKPSVGFGQNTYVPREAIEAERARERIAAPRAGRRTPGIDVQPSRRKEATPPARARATSGRRS